MDKKTLLIFAKRIINSSSPDKATIALKQLRNLLIEQGAQKEYIVLLDEMIYSIPEMKTIAEKDVLTELDILIAKRRAEERIARERAAQYRGRC